MTVLILIVVLSIVLSNVVNRLFIWLARRHDEKRRRIERRLDAIAREWRG